MFEFIGAIVVIGGIFYLLLYWTSTQKTPQQKASEEEYRQKSIENTIIKNSQKRTAIKYIDFVLEIFENHDTINSISLNNEICSRFHCDHGAANEVIHELEMTFLINSIRTTTDLNNETVFEKGEDAYKLSYRFPTFIDFYLSVKARDINISSNGVTSFAGETYGLDDNLVCLSLSLKGNCNYKTTKGTYLASIGFFDFGIVSRKALSRITDISISLTGDFFQFSKVNANDTLSFFDDKEIDWQKFTSGEKNDTKIYKLSPIMKDMTVQEYATLFNTCFQEIISDSAFLSVFDNEHLLSGQKYFTVKGYSKST